MRSALVLMLAVVAVSAAEPDGSRPVDVPDPVGLGERLALIDWLHEHRIETADDATLEQLRIAYLRATAPPAAADGDDDAAERERLALELWRRHGRNPEAGESTAALRARLADLDRREPPDDDGGLVVDAAPDDGGSTRRPAHEKPAKAPKRAKPAKERAPAPPPIDDEHRDAWANYAAPPTQVKGDVEFRLYVLAGDDRHVYLWTDDRSAQKRTADLVVGGVAHIARVYAGVCRRPAVLAVDDAACATLVVGAVDGRAATWDVFSR